MSCYIEVCGNDNFPSEKQCLQAESLFLAKELRSSYKAVYEIWKDCSIEALPNERAYIAGKVVCENYECPKTDSAENRANLSKEIYGVMVGKNEKD